MKKYVERQYKTFEAVRLSEENWSDVYLWAQSVTGGAVCYEDVMRALIDWPDSAVSVDPATGEFVIFSYRGRLLRPSLGEWVVSDGSGFLEVYTNTEFNRRFQEE